MDRRTNNVVIVVGAGASRELARADQFPLMPEWATKFHNDLEANRDTKGLAKQIKLGPALSGLAFERAVGNFLRFSAALDLNREFVTIGKSPNQPQVTSVLNWLNESARSADLFKNALWSSVWSTFGPDLVDDDKAGRAYQGLLNLVKGGPGSVVFATTNYDHAIERGLENLGLPWTDGFSRDVYHPVLKPTGLVDWSVDNKRMIPVLHLHGAVGWYEQSNGEILKVPAIADFNSGLGVPVVSPPDPDKRPESDERLAVLWSQFAIALQGATLVVVVGHSLSDNSLVQELLKAPVPRLLIRPTTGHEGFHHIGASFGPLSDAALEKDYREWPGSWHPTEDLIAPLEGPEGDSHQ